MKAPPVASSERKAGLLDRTTMTQSGDMRCVGHGRSVWEFPVTTGVVAQVNTVQDVIDLMDDTPSDLIVLMHTAGATTLAPLYEDIVGIVCTRGEVRSHVAIISREYGIPCVVGAALDRRQNLIGRRVQIEPSGEILVCAN